MSRLRRAITGTSVAAVCAAALAAGGCGGDDGAASSTTPERGSGAQPQAPSDEQRGQLEQFAACLRENGVDVPEAPPEGGGGVGGAPPAGFDPGDESVQKAMEACREYAPQGGDPGAPGQDGAEAPGTQAQ